MKHLIRFVRFLNKDETGIGWLGVGLTVVGSAVGFGFPLLAKLVWGS